VSPQLLDQLIEVVAKAGMLTQQAFGGPAVVVMLCGQIQHSVAQLTAALTDYLGLLPSATDNGV